MIRTLRKRHLFTFAILAFVVPAVFLAAIVLRPTLPTSEAFQDVLDPVPPRLEPVWQSRASQEGFSLKLSTAQMGSAWVLEVEPEDALAFPDVLVYFTNNADQAALDDAILLGSMAGASRRHFTLPAQSQGQAGQIRFYSLAHRSLLLRHDLPPAATTP